VPSLSRSEGAKPRGGPTSPPGRCSSTCSATTSRLPLCFGRAGVASYQGIGAHVHMISGIAVAITSIDSGSPIRQ
jgi:hypothetical protein